MSNTNSNSNSNSNYYYITTPIYYVNDEPHIGHAYTSIMCDILARYKKLKGYEVFFLTGTDEHGQKVEKSAIAKNMSPIDYCDSLIDSFKILSSLLNLSNNDFIRTTEARHMASVIAIWNKLEENGYIYKGTYSGWYAIRDEAFYSEAELINGKAPTGAEVVWQEEESYFFKLSAMKDVLLKFYTENPNFIWPESRRNEVISFVSGEVKDLSISRLSTKWGIKLPNNENQVIYVWLDALTNYLSALGYPNMNEKSIYLWENSHHVIGKDILRFHAVYWPAFLIAADMQPPKQIISHGWWLNNGEKMSKSLKNVISPKNLVEKYGIDKTRYIFARLMTFGNDGDYSEEKAVLLLNSELSNNIGNLIQRTISIIHKKFSSKIPEVNLENINNNDLIIYCHNEYIDKFNYLMDKYRINDAISLILELGSRANIYIDTHKIWTITDVSSLGEMLFILLEVIKKIAISLAPFIPTSADLILHYLNIKDYKFEEISEITIKAGHIIDKFDPIFMRI